MRTSLRHGALVVIAVVSVASFSTGCRSGGWKMPGSSWVSWGKKPPASSIAGTHDPIQPPSIGIPPYPADDSSSSSAGSTAMASYPSTSPTSPLDKPSAYGPSSPTPSGFDGGVQTAAATTGYDTGPYGTGGASSVAPQTQQGFYRTSTPDNGGPIASTADARGAYPPATSPSYGPAAPNTGYPAPPTSGGAPYGADVVPPTGNYAPVTTPVTGYGAPDAGYPAPVAGSGYPDTNSAPVAPLGNNSAYPASSPATYGGVPYAAGPSGYTNTPPTYGARVVIRSVWDKRHRASPYGTSANYGTATGPAAGTSSSSGGYPPGSTSRNSSLLSPSSGTYSR